MNGQIDDPRIEVYLRSFCPLPPAPLPKRGRNWKFPALSAVAAGVIVMLMAVPQFRRAQSAWAEPQLITIGSANKLLANSPSWKSVIDDAGFAFRSSPAKPSPHLGSALEFLSREDLSK